MLLRRRARILKRRGKCAHLPGKTAPLPRKTRAARACRVPPPLPFCRAIAAFYHRAGDMRALETCVLLRARRAFMTQMCRPSPGLIHVCLPACTTEGGLVFISLTGRICAFHRSVWVTWDGQWISENITFLPPLKRFQALLPPPPPPPPPPFSPLPHCTAHASLSRLLFMMDFG